MKTDPDIAEQLRQAILQADVSRYALSGISGVAQAVLSRFVNGKRTITLDTAAKLAAALGLRLVEDAERGKGRRGWARRKGG